MAAYLTYVLDDGSEILIEVKSPVAGGMVSASPISESIDKAKLTFNEALENVQKSLYQIQMKFHELQADEVEVKFGLKATGQAGNNLFAISQVGIEANYEVTLKWKKQEPVELERKKIIINRKRLKRKTWMR
jgi:hypothetical protein